MEIVVTTLSKDRLQTLARRIRRLLDRWQPPETAVLIATALIVGLGGDWGRSSFAG